MSLKRIFAFSVGGLFILSTHALTCLNGDAINDIEKICQQIDVFRNAALVMMINFRSCTDRCSDQVYIIIVAGMT